MTADESRKPMISTIITAFNKGPWLAEAIDSALAQDFEPHEVLVIDDGSTDDSVEVARRYGDSIRLLTQENRGQANARNRGIGAANGEFIAFLDGDDRWREGKLTKQMAVFEANPETGLVYTDRLKFRGDEIVWPTNRVAHELRRGMVLDHLLGDQFVPFSTVLVRKRCLVDAGLFNEEVRVADDYDIWLRVARMFRFDFVDEVLVEYRLGIDSIGARNRTKIEHTLATQKRFVETYFDGRYPNRRAEARAFANKFGHYGDHLLDGGAHWEAFKAYLTALSHEPSNPRRYRSVIRSLVPNGVVRGVRRLAGQTDAS